MSLSFDELVIQAKSGFSDKTVLQDEISFASLKLHQYLVDLSYKDELTQERRE